MAADCVTFIISLESSCIVDEMSSIFTSCCMEDMTSVLVSSAPEILSTATQRKRITGHRRVFQRNSYFYIFVKHFLYVDLCNYESSVHLQEDFPNISV